MVSLIAGLGGLTFETAGMLVKKCGWIILILWGIGIIMVLLMPLAFPEWQMASFFSTSQIEQKSESAIDVIIPASFSFPNMGKILSMGFVLFAGWVANSVIPVVKYPAFSGQGNECKT